MTQTTFYKLNQWSAEDRILRLDFNDDNGKIDAALHALDGRASQLDGKIAAERTYCNDKLTAERTYTDTGLAAERAALAAHGHWTTISDTTTSGGNQTSYAVYLPNCAEYDIIRIEMDMKGFGRLYFKPDKSCSMSYAPIGNGGSGSSGGIGEASCETFTQILLFPAKDPTSNIIALAFGKYMITSGSTDGTLHFGELPRLVFAVLSPDNYISAGSRIRVFGMK